MHDLVIRDATVVDGTGAPRYAGDVAVDGGTLTQVGGKAGPGRREVDAAGLLVAPGWVDIHTHYDGQATWDAELSPSSWHGVTTTVFGNCGVGFAPAAPDRHGWLIELMEGVEDIPGAALSDGIAWEWESFPEFLDALERRPHAIDFATQVPHGALRAYVMGERGAKNEDATAEDIARMAALVREGIRAGALGFSTSRTSIHKSKSGEHVPGTFAAMDELFGIGKVLGEEGAGVVQMAIEHHESPEEFAWMRRLAEETGRPVLFNLVQADVAPEVWRETLRLLEEAGRDGVPVFGQCAGRPVGVLHGFGATVNPFVACPAWAEVKDLAPEARLDRLKDPAFRARLTAESPPDLGDFANLVTRGWHKMFPLGAEPDYEPGPEKSVAALAAARGVAPAEAAYDALMADGGEGLLYFPLFNYSNGDMQVLHDLMSHERVGISLSDGGAHCGTICDASIPTFLLTHWTRDRSRGPRFEVEFMVRRQTRDTARLFGFHDRGVLAPGYRADFNLIDYAALKLHPPRMVGDLPTGARRFVQRADGYVMTVVGGTPTYENGVATGALPGKLVRGRRPAPAAARAAE